MECMHCQCYIEDADVDECPGCHGRPFEQCAYPQCGKAGYHAPVARDKTTVQ